MSLLMAKEEISKTSWRLPKSKIKELKQYALDHDITVTEALIKAIDLLLKK